MKNHISTFSNLMLKYLVFAFLMGFLFFGCKAKEVESEYVSIPDINFEKKLINLKIDTIQDGKVLRRNIVNLKSLNISGANNEDEKIRDISGIEAFINLELLDCSLNKITHLDVSNHTKLTKLYCYVNQLHNLDVSKNLALKRLGCTYNLLTSLDVSENKSLTLIECQNNKIKNLDITSNILLESLSCSDNLLSNLDISQNSFLYYFDCSNNQLLTLNIISNPQLTYLICNKNQLFSLNICKNIALMYLCCKENIIKVIYLNNLSQVMPDWQKDPTATYKVCP